MLIEESRKRVIQNTEILKNEITNYLNIEVPNDILINESELLYSQLEKAEEM